MSDSDRVLFEDMNGKLDLLVEVVSIMNDRLTRVEIKTDEIAPLAADIKVIKAVQREQGKDLKDLRADLTTVKTTQREHGKDLHDITDYLVEEGMPARA